MTQVLSARVTGGYKVLVILSTEWSAHDPA